MFVNKVLDKYNNGEKSVGTFSWLGSMTAAEALGLGGWDYVIVDNEHGPFSPETSLEMFRVLEKYGATAFARIPDTTRPNVLKYLDAGAKGLIVPNIKTIDECKKLVEYGKYMPVGNRGVAMSNGTDFGLNPEYMEGGLEGYFKLMNERTMIIPQCETVECLEMIDEVFALDGIDGVFVGPFDLSCAMGMPGQFDRPEFQAALKKIVDAAKKANKFVMKFSADAKMAAADLAMGYDSVTLAADVTFLVEASKAAIATAKGE